MKVKWSKMANQVVWRPPNLNVGAMGNRNISTNSRFERRLLRQEQQQGQTYFPSGENSTAFTGLCKLR
jgi:hypothetical protein